MPYESGQCYEGLLPLIEALGNKVLSHVGLIGRSRERCDA